MVEVEERNMKSRVKFSMECEEGRYSGSCDGGAGVGYFYTLVPVYY